MKLTVMGEHREFSNTERLGGLKCFQIFLRMFPGVLSRNSSEAAAFNNQRTQLAICDGSGRPPSLNITFTPKLQFSLLHLAVVCFLSSASPEGGFTSYT